MMYLLKRMLLVMVAGGFVFSSVAMCADIPLEEFKELMAKPTEQPETPQQQRELIIGYMQKVLDGAQELIKKYPNADNLYKAQEMVMMAGMQLVSAGVDKEKNLKIVTKQADDIIKSSNSKDEAKFGAYAMKAMLALRNPSGEKPGAVIKKFFEKASKIKEKEAYAVAIQMAMAGQNKELALEYAEKASKKYPDEPMFAQIKQKLNKPSYIGKEFKAELTTLNGKKISLPKDYLGKVVIIDFWASWCGPCRYYAKTSLSKIYKKYKGKGVVIIGISLDKNKSQMEDYLKKSGHGWIITYSGDGWNDKTARAYGIDGIPSVWLIGKDGKVVTDEARGRLEQLLPKLLK